MGLREIVQYPKASTTITTESKQGFINMWLVLSITTHTSKSSLDLKYRILFPLKKISHATSRVQQKKWQHCLHDLRYSPRKWIYPHLFQIADNSNVY